MSEFEFDMIGPLLGDFQAEEPLDIASSDKDCIILEDNIHKEDTKSLVVSQYDSDLPYKSQLARIVNRS